MMSQLPRCDAPPILEAKSVSTRMFHKPSELSVHHMSMPSHFSVSDLLLVPTSLTQMHTSFRDKCTEVHQTCGRLVREMSSFLCRLLPLLWHPDVAWKSLIDALVVSWLT